MDVALAQTSPSVRKIVAVTLSASIIFSNHCLDVINGLLLWRVPGFGPALGIVNLNPRSTQFSAQKDGVDIISVEPV
jgi:hypothetical protein